MSLKCLISFVTVSGIFRKSDVGLDILPPPPPFPDVEKEIERIKEDKKIMKRGVKQKERNESKYKERKLKERDREIQLKRVKPKKETFFRKIFGGKKDEIGVSKESESIEKVAQKPLKERKKGVVETKLEMSEMGQFGKETEKPVGVLEEKEIQKAIEGVKGVKKKPSIMRGLFKKREKPAEEKVEMPEVMPRVEGKEDSIELIEEKMHKARLALMEFKFYEAKSIYVEIMKMYNGLDPKKKLKVYQDIKDLYYERKTAEKFAK